MRIFEGARMREVVKLVEEGVDGGGGGAHGSS